MKILQGKYNFAKVFTDNLEEVTEKQIISMLNHPVFGGKKQIRIMPDCHAGKGSVVGFTMQLGNHIIPSTIGVDIGCGIYSWNIGKKDINFSEFDNFIREYIPSGFNNRNSIYDKIPELNDFVNNLLFNTCDKLKLNFDNVAKSIGSVGGGNHFIECGKDNNDEIWITIHTGSRNFGLQVAKYYQDKAVEFTKDALIEVEKGMEFLPMKYGGSDYLIDMQVAQTLADWNRKVIGKQIMEFLNVTSKDSVFSVHNYINLKDKMIRKGAISARKGERVVIPFNMRDGLIIGTGKGNYDWNMSAPHGAGRILSRSKANNSLSLDEFEKSMEGIFTTCVSKDTLDESPMAYKDMTEIMENIKDTVTIDLNVKPLYNFKASE
jgi:RNA-splicing ligase RtcB